MHYFITDATGSIGKRLVRRLLEREDATVHFLIREESQGKVAGLQAYWGVDAGAGKAIPVFGDLTKKGLGVAAADIKKLKGRIDHFYHLAAVYDLAADEESQVAVNIEVAPTNLYNNVPTLAPEEAADMIAQACIFKPVRIATRLGVAGQLVHALMPRVAPIAMNTSLRMFPDSTVAKGDKNASRCCRPKRLPCSR